jgi:hypothetical protein
MKLFLGTFLVSWLLAIDLYAQWNLPPLIRSQNTLDRLSDWNGLGNSEQLFGLSLPPGEIRGSYYLDDKWNLATIMLYENDRVISGFPIRFDLKSNIIEIRSRNDFRVLPTKLIKSIVWIDSVNQLPHYFLNLREFQSKSVSFDGLFEVLVDGSLSLFKLTLITEVKPNYVVALDVGSRDIKIVKKEVFFYAVGKELIEIVNAKLLERSLSKLNPAMDLYLEGNKISIKKQPALVYLFEHYNSLTDD